MRIHSHVRCLSMCIYIYIYAYIYIYLPLIAKASFTLARDAFLCAGVVFLNTTLQKRCSRLSETHIPIFGQIMLVVVFIKNHHHYQFIDKHVFLITHCSCFPKWARRLNETHIFVLFVPLHGSTHASWHISPGKRVVLCVYIYIC